MNDYSSDAHLSPGDLVEWRHPADSNENKEWFSWRSGLKTGLVVSTRIAEVDVVDDDGKWGACIIPKAKVLWNESSETNTSQRLLTKITATKKER